MKKKVASIICILMIIFLIIGGFIYFKKQAELNANPSGLSGYIIGEGAEPGLTPEELKALMQKQVDESKIAFSINSEPVFKGKKGNIVFANPRYNAYDIDLVAEVDGKTVLKTDKIAPNQYIEEIQLIGKPLKKGKHKGVALIRSYKKDTGEEVGKVSVELDITSK